MAEGMAPTVATAAGGAGTRDDEQASKKFSPGVVLGKDGKPCRSCSSFASFTASARQQTKATAAPGTTTTTTSSAAAPSGPPPDCPADVEVLGRSTWTLLHTMAATYPEQPSASQQSDMLGFVKLFSRLYPCWVCAEDFRAYMGPGGKGGQPRVGSRSELGLWMCGAHNEVNRKLGKPEFDCSRWEERWRTGWKDGRCD